ncbi:TetR/AcrR family transcriptional regulator [Streptomyces sp. Ru72]|uniref:TetR/AcrR family transcriptional regulator n=1 Tax=Streptomyces sp. Ru72 TaxID=2080747 RepID=UPI000CDE18C4|nr:TetR family transcriptional regulator [Streptomyces sp. Ru72]POX50088.1 TetR family transcriptional regulator [Streptomyces sp. Ru72]
MTETVVDGGTGGQGKRPGYGQGREALMAAAIRVVARGGLRKLTYRSVAAEAGVTHGLVVHHFGSRDTLLEDALGWAVRRSIETSSLVPTSGRLEDFAATLAGFIAADPDLQAFQYELKLEARRRPELQPYVDALYEAYRDAVREALACFGVSEEAVEIVFAALEGLVFHQVTSGDPHRTEDGVEALRGLLAAHRRQTPP